MKDSDRHVMNFNRKPSYKELEAEVEWYKGRMQAVLDTAIFNIEHGCVEKGKEELEYLKCLAEMTLKEPRDET